MSDSFSHLELGLEGPVGELVFARPDRRNAMTPEMGDEIWASCRYGEINGAETDDDDVRPPLSARGRRGS